MGKISSGSLTAGRPAVLVPALDFSLEVYMKFISNTTVLACAALFACQTWATTVCELDGITRSVSILYNEPGQPTPCEVLYKKNNENQTMTLWRAQNEADYCEARAAEFVQKLVDLNWACSAEVVNANLSNRQTE